MELLCVDFNGILVNLLTFLTSSISSGLMITILMGVGASALAGACRGAVAGARQGAAAARARRGIQTGGTSGTSARPGTTITRTGTATGETSTRPAATVTEGGTKTNVNIEANIDRIIGYAIGGGVAFELGRRVLEKDVDIEAQDVKIKIRDKNAPDSSISGSGSRTSSK